ncbi:MAG: hypothetical protein A3H96_00310 [Acidobacteria bacterium RIFCSPLOWO2_02_FULL_67_36]|nr:MAG: hypothetical protein A3H96_00310 [Acidobacteria bacterium RIFCSPLOWO2_02_FULL_67_36]OFW23140.1 MAG: hypothetical protein A3G21_01040 [Acidobacteria bacterium RIFCSPLOWO2_12_FULL_66_21]
MSIRLITRSIWANPGNRGRRLQKTLAAVAWQIRKRTVGSTRLLRLPNGMLFRAHPDCVVSSALIYANWPEYRELMFLRSSLSRGEVLLDVGANVGHISLLLADCVGPANIFAFEPAPTAFERLTENWRLNGWDTLRLVQAAVGGEPGWAYVDDVPHPTTTNRVYATALADSSVRVPLVRLDDFREHLKGRPVGLLKIDVEGFEGSVLRGAYRLLLEDRPRIVMFESLDAQPTPAVETILKEADYVIFQLDSGGRPDFSTLSNQNLFAIPAELRGSLAG